MKIIRRHIDIQLPKGKSAFLWGARKLRYGHANLVGGRAWTIFLEKLWGNELL